VQCTPKYGYSNNFSFHVVSCDNSVVLQMASAGFVKLQPGKCLAAKNYKGFCTFLTILKKTIKA
jgi:hypothetical protein